MPAPYYADDLVTLFHGKCEDITDWLAADVLVTDPPYGRGWKQGTIQGKGAGRTPGNRSASHGGIKGDANTAIRDEALATWGDRVAAVFGDLMLAPAPGTKQVLPYRKPPDAGTRGAVGGFRRDAEAVYLIGPWPTGLGGRTSFVTTTARSQGNPYGVSAISGHPHAKPVDVMEHLIRACPPGVIADPFAGSGSTLVAARNLGRRAIGVELEERYCERAALRLSQMVLEIA